MLGNQAFGPYGSTQYQSGNIGTAKGFTGQYQDPSGLDYDNARYYDPVVGLFISADTVQSNQQGMNPYAYVGGNPETDTDPTGNFVSSGTYSSNPEQSPVYYPGSSSYSIGGESYPIYGTSGAPTGCNGFACYEGGQTIIKHTNAAGGHPPSLKPGTSSGGTSGNGSGTTGSGTGQGGNTTAQCKLDCQYNKAKPAYIKHLNHVLTAFMILGDFDALLFDTINIVLQSIAGGALTVISRVLIILGSVLSHLFHLAIDLYTFFHGSAPTWLTNLLPTIDYIAEIANIINVGITIISGGLFEFEEGIADTIAARATAVFKGPVMWVLGSFAGLFGSTSQLGIDGVTHELEDVNTEGKQQLIDNCVGQIGAQACGLS